MKYFEPGAVPATFTQLREAYLKLGLQVEEMRFSRSSSPVKMVHDGVPYVLDVYHDLADVKTVAAKYYIIVERHHEDIKRLYNAWRPLCGKEMTVMVGGGLQLQAFFTTPGCYEGILYLSLIDDGRFVGIEAALREHGVPVIPYKPDANTFKGPHTLVLKPHWFETLPDVENIEMRCEKTNKRRKPLVDRPE